MLSIPKLAGHTQVTATAPREGGSNHIPAKLADVRVAYLGHVGMSWVGETSSREVKRAKLYHPHWRKVAIDIRESSDMNGCEHIHADFRYGLERLPDDSMARIDSFFALGYYTQNGLQVLGDALLELSRGHFLIALERYTTAVIGVAHRKLMPGGALRVVAHDRVAELLQACGALTPFGAEHITCRRLHRRAEATYWEKVFNWTGKPSYLVLLRKEGKRSLSYL